MSGLFQQSMATLHGYENQTLIGHYRRKLAHYLKKRIDEIIICRRLQYIKRTGLFSVENQLIKSQEQQKIT